MITNYAVISVLARGSEALIKNRSLAVAARPEDVKTKAPILNRDRQGAVFD
jgi:hypothetical protein